MLTNGHSESNRPLAAASGVKRLCVAVVLGALFMTSCARAETNDIAAIVEKEQQFQNALQAGRAAFERKDYETAQNQVEQALALKPVNVDAIILREDIRTELAKNAELRRREAQYENAMLKVRGAFDHQDYSNALVQVREALKVKPGNAGALALSNRAAIGFLGSNPARLDEQLEVLLVNFNLLKPQSARTEAGREAGPLSSAIGLQVKQRCLAEAASLQTQFRLIGWLHQDGRDKDLQRLKEAIQNWE